MRFHEIIRFAIENWHFSEWGFRCAVSELGFRINKRKEVEALWEGGQGWWWLVGWLIGWVGGWMGGWVGGGVRGHGDDPDKEGDEGG